MTKSALNFRWRAKAVGRRFRGRRYPSDGRRTACRGGVRAPDAWHRCSLGRERL